MIARRSIASTSLLRLLFFAAVVPLALAGCSSFPRPSSDSESLFVLLSEYTIPRGIAERGPSVLLFEGRPSFRIAIGEEENRVYVERVKAGHYKLTDAPALGLGPEAAEFDVPPGTVYLYSQKFTRARSSGVFSSRRMSPVTPEDQKAAAAFLVDYLDFEKWYGREIVGFGSYPPRLGQQEGEVSFEVSSTPAGAQVTIDDQAWGATPVTTRLQVGKHLVQLEIPGVALTRTFVDVQAAGEINITLPILPEEEAARAKERAGRITILLSAFQNMGSPEADNLRAVFPQVIANDLKNDPRLVLVDAGELVAQGKGIPGMPDFSVANQRGIDLIVSGYYTARPDGLLVYAALYDVRNEIARTSIMYTGKAGLAMFESVDAMAAEFSQGIDKVIPDVRSRVQKGGAVQSRLVTYERRRSENTVIGKRQERRSALALVTGPGIGIIEGLSLPSFPYALLAITPLGVSFDYAPGGPLSLLAILRLGIAFDRNTGSDASYASRPYIDIPLRVGPAYTLYGYEADLSFALLAEGRYVQAWFDNGTGGKDYNSIVAGVLTLETSTRLYLQSRVSETPAFVLIGFEWFLLGGQMRTDFNGLKANPLGLALTLGYGVRI